MLTRDGSLQFLPRISSDAADNHPNLGKGAITNQTQRRLLEGLVQSGVTDRRS